MNENILEVSGLKTHFFGDKGSVPAVDGVDFRVRKGEILGIVGESGSGKSVTSLSIMGLLRDTSGKIVAGSVKFDGEELTGFTEKQMRRIRGNDMAMIFQEPMTSLNPVKKIGEQIQEAVLLHLKYNKKLARQHTINMLKQVGIPRADEVIFEYPHQLSGGMRQRVMIAMAMSCNPKFLIADEPTTALDVTIQAQILELMKGLQKEENTSILLITHDLGVVAEMCSRVVVMYAGKVVEEADVYELFANPKHPYTKGLINSVPKLRQGSKRLDSIPGNVPDPANMPSGCKFAPRCAHVMDICHSKDPALELLDDEHSCRCWLYQNKSESKEVEHGKAFS
ncbi:peptide ABC transporter ATP-binding protein [Virgibacillus phasianinus]|uniref:Peptide ABC transporter ATP-binding protein n=1 Tax=Virgibacillus phasianinus TaxID=2017483 RepID=A0A220U2K9_9BACI|nr:ABC transporter ATP-binding protein [Virgibacillus phasianinus]ASK62330.1 peptide ABC transporter ATP-binding protein [Virgibacillus phasianinus]